MLLHFSRETQKGYLITSLQLLAQQKKANPSPVLLAAIITLLTTHHGSLADYLPPTGNTPERVLRLARKATEKESTKHSAQVWLARLDAEKQLSASDDVKRAWDEARAAVVGAGTETVWLWGLDPEPDWEATTTTTEPGTAIAETGAEERIRLLAVRAHSSAFLAPALTALRGTHCAPCPSIVSLCDRVDPPGVVYVLL